MMIAHVLSPNYDGYLSETPTRAALIPKEFNFSGSHKVELEILQQEQGC